jgi:hypothetical protein
MSASRVSDASLQLAFLAGIFDSLLDARAFSRQAAWSPALM